MQIEMVLRFHSSIKLAKNFKRYLFKKKWIVSFSWWCYKSYNHLEEWFRTGTVLPSHGNRWQYLKTFFVNTNGARELILVSSGQKPETLLSIS